MEKTIAPKDSQNRILNEIAELINTKVEIFNRCFNVEEDRDRAFVKEDEVNVVPGKSHFFTGSVFENVMEVISYYLNKYDNLYWHIDTTPVPVFDSNNDIYWLHIPHVSVSFINE